MLAKICIFGNLEESLIRGIIMIGTEDNAIRKRLLQDSKLTLKSCIDFCGAYESTTTRRQSMTQEEVHAVKKTTRRAYEKTPKGTSSYSDADEKKKCKLCDKNHVFVKVKCPAWGKSCTAFGGRNHFLVVSKKT